MAAADPATWPLKTTLQGIPAVYFNSSADGVNDRLEAANTAFPFSQIYGSSDWSLEVWAWQDGYYAENALFQVSFQV